MSVGNLKSEGNKGNNFPWQLKMLQGLQCICDELKEINVDTTAIEQAIQDVEAVLQTIEVNTSGVARTPGMLRPTGAGNVNVSAATFYAVSVANVGAANGTVLGQTIKPGEVLNFSADALNNYFTSFAYDATGTEFIITYVY